MIFDLDGTPPDIGFPDTSLAETDPNGLLAVGGDLSADRILSAYTQGIFPWFSAGQPILWWSPAPRMVLFPDELRVSRSLRKTLRNKGFETSINRAFDAVIRGCAAPSAGRQETWLVPEMIDAYEQLNLAGHAHSFEVWHDDLLVGGLYGIGIGEAFFGESMFSRRRDASKVALVLLAECAQHLPLRFIDCQVHTDHLASLGAREIGRDRFNEILQPAVAARSQPVGDSGKRPAAALRSAQ